MRWKIKYGVLTAVVCVDLSNEANTCTIWCCKNFQGFGNNYAFYTEVCNQVVIFTKLMFASCLNLTSDL